MNTIKYNTIRTIPKSFRKIIEAELKLIPLTHIYMTTLSPVNLLYGPKPRSSLSEMMQSTKCFLHVSKTLALKLAYCKS
jgi:hypothetical protein